jgi:hypothetical protein
VRFEELTQRCPQLSIVALADSIENSLKGDGSVFKPATNGDDRLGEHKVINTFEILDLIPLRIVAP